MLLDDQLVLDAVLLDDPLELDRDDQLELDSVLLEDWELDPDGRLLLLDERLLDECQPLELEDQLLELDG